MFLQIYADLLAQGQKLRLPAIVELQRIDPAPTLGDIVHQRQRRARVVQHLHALFPRGKTAKMLLGCHQRRNAVCGFLAPTHKVSQEQAEGMIAPVDIGGVSDQLVPKIPIGERGLARVERQRIENGQRGRSCVEQRPPGAEIACEERTGQDGGLFIATTVHRMALARILHQKRVHLHVGQPCADAFGHDHAAVAIGLLKGRKVLVETPIQVDKTGWHRLIREFVRRAFVEIGLHSCGASRPTLSQYQ